MPDDVLSSSYCVDAAHPALAGHFPANPIVPAVLLASFIAQSLQRGGKSLRGFERLKFLRPVSPGERLDVTVRGLQAARGDVEIAVDGELVAKGQWLSTLN
jgi:3-hydroxyacyl-[acyl-carrier-protein] dehydratase